MTQVVRKNLTVEEKKLRALRHALGAASESDAFRQAVDRVLTWPALKFVTPIL